VEPRTYFSQEDLACAFIYAGDFYSNYFTVAFTLSFENFGESSFTEKFEGFVLLEQL